MHEASAARSAFSDLMFGAASSVTREPLRTKRQRDDGGSPPGLSGRSRADRTKRPARIFQLMAAIRSASGAGAPNCVDSACAAAVISLRISARCSSVARISGVEALIAPTTVPA